MLNLSARMPGLPAMSLAAAMLLSVMPAQAREIEGVDLPERVEQGGVGLQLNGAGVRSKFFFDIYVGALYLPQKTGDAATVLEHPAPARVDMHILYDEVSADKLVHGWQAGFAKNQDAAAMQALSPRLDAFNALFGDARRGDVLRFELLADGGTRVLVNGREKGRIEGKDFQRALLAVWLGKAPADADLKRGMLGLN